MAKKEHKSKWSWSTAVITLLLLALLVLWSEYNSLSEEYGNYRVEVEKSLLETKMDLINALNELELNLTKGYANMDCYERGTVECYEGRVYCYDEPQITKSCESGYSLVCAKN